MFTVYGVRLSSLYTWSNYIALKMSAMMNWNMFLRLIKILVFTSTYYASILLSISIFIYTYEYLSVRLPMYL